MEKDKVYEFDLMGKVLYEKKHLKDMNLLFGFVILFLAFIFLMDFNLLVLYFFVIR